MSTIATRIYARRILGVITMASWLAFSCLPIPGLASTTESATRTSSALLQLQHFKASRVIDDATTLASLQSAIFTMQSAIDVRTLTPENFIIQRRIMVQNWAQILGTIEQSYDPSFDPRNDNDIPDTCVIPPGGLPCGTIPGAVKNAQARAEYDAELKSNALKQKKAEYYSQLNALDLSAMSILESTLQLYNRVAPEGAGADFFALDDILRAAGISDKRRANLKAWIYPRSSP